MNITENLKERKNVLTNYEMNEFKENIFNDFNRKEKLNDNYKKNGIERSFIINEEIEIRIFYDLFD